MKRPLLILSATLNAILFGVIIFRAPVAPVTAHVPAVRLPSRESFPGLNLPEPTLTQPGPGQAVTVDDLAQLPALVARLRKNGVSEDVLADIVAGQLQRKQRAWVLEQQRKDRRGEVDPSSWWQGNRQWDAELEQSMRALVGNEAYERWDKQNVLERFAASSATLSDAEADALYRLEKERRQQEITLSASHGAGEIDPQDYQKQRNDLRKDAEQRVAQLLGAERAGRLRQEADWAAGQMRWSLRDLNLTQAQFDGLTVANQQAQEQNAELQALAQSGAKIEGNRWQEIQTAKEREIERVIGSQSYIEYQKRQDHRYQQMVRYAPAWQLTATDINCVYKTLDDGRRAAEEYRKQAQSLQSHGQQVDWSEINRGVAEYRKEVDAELRRYLGDQRYERLKRAGIVHSNF